MAVPTDVLRLLLVLLIAEASGCLSWLIWENASVEPCGAIIPTPNPIIAIPIKIPMKLGCELKTLIK